jgi:hypothetical protein
MPAVKRMKVKRWHVDVACEPLKMKKKKRLDQSQEREKEY